MQSVTALNTSKREGQCAFSSALSVTYHRSRLLCHGVGPALRTSIRQQSTCCSLGMPCVAFNSLRSSVHCTGNQHTRSYLHLFRAKTTPQNVSNLLKPAMNGDLSRTPSAKQDKNSDTSRRHALHLSACISHPALINAFASLGAARRTNRPSVTNTRGLKVSVGSIVTAHHTCWPLIMYDIGAMYDLSEPSHVCVAERRVCYLCVIHTRIDTATRGTRNIPRRTILCPRERLLSD